VILISKYIVPKGYTGIAIFPFMFLKKKYMKENVFLINHEKIHLRQQIELLVIPFFVIYIIEFLIRLIQYRDWNIAYMNISFEREAYDKEKDLDYLKSRSFWYFLKYYKLIE